ncbi:hypothetical protein A5656_09585, partial [Mycobacterium gordonae]
MEVDMNALLWTLQIALATVFAGSGLAKISQPKERLIAIGQTGVTPFPLPVIRFTAFCELLGAIGILLPWLTGVGRFLTPLAAGGFAIVMVGAIGSHAHLREPRNVALTVAILVASVTVAVGRAVGLCNTASSAKICSMVSNRPASTAPRKDRLLTAP